MKKVLLSLLAVAALVLSCQNYDDEFDALNAKVASLESQISSLADLRTAVTSVQSSVSALQAAVSGLDYSSDIAAILDDLGELATAIDGATTSADLDALKGELNTSLDALKALIEANSSSIASLVATNADLKSELEALGIDVDAVLAQNSTYTGNINITNAAELAFAKSLGDRVKIINGNVKITIGYTNDLTAADVAPVSKLIEQVVGNVTLSMDHEPIDLSALVNVSGDYLVEGWDPTDDNLANVGDIYLEYRFPYSYPNLLTAKKIILSDLGKSDGTTKSTTAVTEPIGAQPGVTSVSFLALTSATSISTGSADAHSSGASTHSSGGNINLTAGGSAGVLSLLNAETVKIGDVAVTSLKVNKATAVELHFDGAATGIAVEDTNAGTTSDPEVLASVTIKAKSASGAISIDMLKTGTFDASLLADAGSTLTSDALVNTLPVLASVDGMTLSEATSISLPKLARVGDVVSGVASVNAFSADKVTGTVSLPALTDAGDLSFDKADGFTAPLATIKSLDLSDIGEEMSVELKSLSSGTTLGSISSTDAGNIASIKIHGQEVSFGVAGLNALSNLTSATLNGDAASIVWDVTSSHSKLVSLTVGGKNSTVNVKTSTTATATALTTIVTSGTINKVDIDGNADLVTLTLGHDNEVSATSAPILYVKNNVKLASLTTSMTTISDLQVIDNHRLATLDFSSINALPANYTSASTTTVKVSGNFADGDEYISKLGATANSTATNAGGRLAYTVGLTGTYQPLTASQARVYGQSGLATLKTLFSLIESKYTATTGSVKPALVIDIQYRYDSSASGATASTATVGNVVLGGTSAANSATLTANTIAPITNTGLDMTDLLDEIALLQ